MSETPPDVNEIRAAISARMQHLKPLVEECERLEKAEAALDKASKLGLVGDLEPAAPYGYKADGTPRKRRAPSDPDYARRGWETRRQAAEA